MNRELVARELLVVAKMLTGGFSSDTDKWFDKVADEVDDSSKYAAILKVVNGAPTKKALEQLKLALKGGEKWKKLVLEFIKKMEKGTYEKEFKNFDGKHSQVSELFSFLKQALTYND